MGIGFGPNKTVAKDAAATAALESLDANAQATAAQQGSGL